MATRFVNLDHDTSRMLLALLIYSYATGIFSSRSIEQSTHDRGPVAPAHRRHPSGSRHELRLALRQPGPAQRELRESSPAHRRRRRHPHRHGGQCGGGDRPALTAAWPLWKRSPSLSRRRPGGLHCQATLQATDWPRRSEPSRAAGRWFSQPPGRPPSSAALSQVRQAASGVFIGTSSWVLRCFGWNEFKPGRNRARAAAAQG